MVMDFIKNKSPRKLLNIILINISFLIIFLFIIEFLSYKILLKRYPCKDSNFWLYNYCCDKNDIERRFLDSHPLKFKTFQIFSSSKNIPYKSIVVFGCSMAYGYNLKDHQTISYKLSEKLGCKVYNLAVPAGGLNQILYILQRFDITEYIKEEPEYFIYFYNPDHLRRMFMKCTTTMKEPQFVFYEKRNGKLLLQKNLLIQNTWFYALVHDEIRFCIKNRFSKILENKAKDYFLLYLSTIQSKIKELYPNSKFIIVKFSSDNFDIALKEKYSVIDIPQITGIDVMLNTPENIEKYNIDSGFHPNEYYWNLILPVLVDKLNKF